MHECGGGRHTASSRLRASLVLLPGSGRLPVLLFLAPRVPAWLPDHHDLINALEAVTAEMARSNGVARH